MRFFNLVESLGLLGFFTVTLLSFNVMASTPFSLELGVDPHMEATVSQFVHDRLPVNHGFSDAEVDTLVKDLSVLASIKGGESSGLYYDIFMYQRQFQGEWLLRWLLNGIKTLKSSKGDFCLSLSESAYNACAIFASKTILLSPQHFQHDRLRRLLTLIHERRHFDGYNHVPGTPSYDDTVQGANGAQLAFLVTLVNSCSNCTAITKHTALDYIQEMSSKLIHLPSGELERLNQELASIKPELPSEITGFISTLKADKSFVTITHFECKNGTPLYEYDHLNSKIPNVNAVDCFFVYFRENMSPNVRDRFSTTSPKGQNYTFSFVPIKN
ncbi:MAG: hypothetical protein ACXVCY_12300 [Pseudobdellovibrionaceae bacterium]